MTASDDHLDTGDLTFENAAQNPELLAAATSLSDDSKPPVLPDPSDGPVTLPGGYRRVVSTDGGSRMEEIRSAWVRELNGEDEERIARAKLKDVTTAFVNAVLESGVERLGDERPTRDDFKSLLMGDVQFLLMEIARATYGDEITYSDFQCPGCGKDFDVTLSISEDIPVTRLDKVDDADFEVRLKGDRVAKVTLPTAEVQEEITKNNLTDAEINTLLITRCVEEIRGSKTQRILGDEAAARRLSIPDRKALVEEMGKRMPGPHYNGVKFNHDPGCGEEIRLGVTLADLFRGL